MIFDLLDSIKISELVCGCWHFKWLNSYPYLYKGFTPNKGILFVKSYRKVRIKDIYPGIEMPNADIAQIKIDIKYADLELLDDRKILSLKTLIGEIR